MVVVHFQEPMISMSNAIILQSETLHYMAPLYLCERTNISDAITKQNFPIVFSRVPLIESCVICTLPMESDLVRIKACTHVFHKSCLAGVEVNLDPQCPKCNQPFDSSSPVNFSGKMIVNSIEDICPGFGIWTKTIKIDYIFYGGKNHLNRMSFLPKNEAGFQLLRRLEYAWMHGILFSIKSSPTKSLHLSSPIQQKSDLHGGGPRGFPDPKFIQQCNNELTAQGVPLKISKEKFVFPKIIDYTMSSSRNLVDSQINCVEDLNIIPVAASAPMWYLDDCLICSDTLFQSPSVQINSCGHYVHESCLEKHLRRELKCPTCRTNVSEPQGKGPSGSMTIKLISTICPGYKSQTIQITYHIPAGTQLEYHENPGAPYPSIERTAYIPNTEEGRALLLRLKYAWNHGLTFLIGTSQASGKPNSVTWSSIEHKTTLQGGPYGFPDQGYIRKCNETLDKLRVPDAKSLK
jgi:deltex